VDTSSAEKKKVLDQQTITSSVPAYTALGQLTAIFLRQRLARLAFGTQANLFP